ncbi:hypothetical protein A2U01_0095562, partial [Trifolium medium]|nr:hypothetical protein [Trifolium medium]
GRGKIVSTMETRIRRVAKLEEEGRVVAIITSAVRRVTRLLSVRRRMISALDVEGKGIGPMSVGRR